MRRVLKRARTFGPVAVGGILVCSLPVLLTLKGHRDYLRRVPRAWEVDSRPLMSTTLGVPSSSCEACEHLPTVMFGGYGGLRCPCLEQPLPPVHEMTLMSPADVETRTRLPRLYLDLLKSAVLNRFYADDASVVDGSSHPRFDARLTMVGRRRLDNTQQLLEIVLAEGVPGDFVELGSWRGGSTMLAAGVLSVFGQFGASRRHVWMADSFLGIPPVKPSLFPDDAAHVGAEKLSQGEFNSPTQVLRSFDLAGLASGTDRSAIHVVPGFFNNTLHQPALQTALKRRRISLLRLDSDVYESTMQSLEALYDHVAVGGFVVVDDYLDWVGARRAALDFRRRRGITAPIVPVFHEHLQYAAVDDVNNPNVPRGEIPRGVWWRKEA